MTINFPTLQFLRGQIGMPMSSTGNARGSLLGTNTALSLDPSLSLGGGTGFGFENPAGFDPLAAFTNGAQSLFPNYGGFQKIPGLGGIFSIAAPGAEFMAGANAAINFGSVLNSGSLTEGEKGPYDMWYPVGTLSAIGNPQSLIDLFGGVTQAEFAEKRGRAGLLAASQMPGVFPMGRAMNAGGPGTGAQTLGNRGSAAGNQPAEAPPAADNNQSTPPPALDAATVQSQLQAAGYTIDNEATALTNMLMAKDATQRGELLQGLKKAAEQKDPKERYKEAANVVLQAYVDEKAVGKEVANKLFNGAFSIKGGDLDPSKGLGVFIGRLKYLKGLVDSGNGVESPKFTEAIAGYRSQG